MEEQMHKLPPRNTELLIAELIKELQRLKYSQSTISRMNSVWKRLVLYGQKCGATEFSMELARKFSVECFGHALGEKDASHNAFRALHILGDFMRFGVIFKQSSIVSAGFSDGYRELFERFLENLKETLNYADGSIQTWRNRLFRLERYLLAMNVRQFSDARLEHFNRYIESLLGFSSAVASGTVLLIKRLCDFAHENGYHAQTFSAAMPPVKRNRSRRLPNVLTDGEIDKVLAAVDRGSPVGKRNYAMLMLVVRYGLRIGDVRLLTFDAFDWHKNTISLMQSKTAKPLELPLLNDVGWAIIDYLKKGRPQTSCENIFIRHCAPFGAIGDNLHAIVVELLRKVGIETPPDKMRGMHSFRHSLASSMLDQNIPLHVISQTLGHTNIKSTESYLKIDLHHLRLCALEVDL